MKDDLARNEKITILVLKGYTLEQVGMVFGITGERIRQIAFKTCRKVLKAKLKNRHVYAWCGLRDLRKNKNRIISLIEGI